MAPMKLTTNDGAFQTWNQDSKSLGETNQNGAQPVEIQRLKSQNTTFKSTSFRIKTILRSSILAYVTLLELEFTQPFSKRSVFEKTSEASPNHFKSNRMWSQAFSALEISSSSALVQTALLAPTNFVLLQFVQHSGSRTSI